MLKKSYVTFLRVEDRGVGPAAIFRDNITDETFALICDSLLLRIDNMTARGFDVSEETTALAKILPNPDFEYKRPEQEQGDEK